LYEATPGLRSHDAVGDSLEGETRGAGPVAGSLPLRCGGEGARGEPWIGLTGSGAEAASGDLLPQSRHEAEDFLSIQKGHVCKPQFMLALHKALEVFGLDLVLGQQQVAALSVLQLGFQFLGQGGPAREGGAGEDSLSRVQSLGTHSWPMARIPSWDSHLRR